MSATQNFFDFNEQYMNINTKLKKKFMRKPNIAEATNEFTALAIQCDHLDLPSYAGQAYEGAAKCESSNGNIFGEAEHRLSAARQFIKAEKKLKSLKFHSPERENLEAAMSNYLQALQIYPHNSPLRTSILLEMADSLVALNKKNEAAVYYERALDTIQDSAIKVHHMMNMLNLYIDCGKYEAAFDMSNRLCEQETGVAGDNLAEVEISRILLTLLIEPSDSRKPESLKKLFYNIANDNETGIPINADISLKLQSLIVCVETKDSNSLVKLSAELKPYLTANQRDLIILLIKGLR